jgi:hypothetical protein
MAVRAVSLFGRLALGAALLGGLASPAAAQKEFRYDAKNADVAAHWAARATLASAVMFSGLGEQLNMSVDERDAALRYAGYVTRPPQPKVAIVGALYAAGAPRLKEKPDPANPPTLRWDQATFDRTLDPAAQAWSLVKITSPGFHLQYHEPPEDKRIGLMMVPQARAQARTLAARLRDRDGLFAARSAEGRLAAPAPRDQAAVLWAAANLILAATDASDDYWHKAYRDLIDPEDYRPLAEAALGALEKLAPHSAGDRALAIEALGRYALAARHAARRSHALALARAHAEALAQGAGDSLEDLGLAVYGLSEAARVLAAPRYAEAAAERFRGTLLPLWNEALGAFSPPRGGAPVYTPRTLGALIAALNAMRWHGPPELAREAGRLYPRLFETVLVRAGLLQSSPLAIVTPLYRAKEPDAHFAHPALPSPVERRVAPVFAAEVRHEAGAWRVSDASFRTAEAMFLAVMLAMRHGEDADPFLPSARLAALKR